MRFSFLLFCCLLFDFDVFFINALQFDIENKNQTTSTELRTKRRFKTKTNVTNNKRLKAKTLDLNLLKKLPQEVLSEVVKSFLLIDDKISFYKAFPNLPNDVFKNKTQIYVYWVDLLDSKNTDMIKNMLDFANLTNLQSELSNMDKFKLLNKSSKYLDYQLFEFVLRNVTLNDTQLETLLTTNFITYKIPLDVNEKSNQFNIVKILLNFKRDFVIEWIYKHFIDVFENINFTMVEFLVDSFIDVNTLVDGYPIWFSVIIFLPNIFRDKPGRLNRDEVVNIYKFIFKNVKDFGQRDIHGFNITQEISQFLVNRKDIRRLYVLLNI